MTLNEFRKQTKGKDGSLEIYITNGEIEAAGGGTPLFRSDGVNFMEANYVDDETNAEMGEEILFLSYFDTDFANPEFLSDDRALEVEIEREEI